MERGEFGDDREENIMMFVVASLRPSSLKRSNLIKQQMSIIKNY